MFTHSNKAGSWSSDSRMSNIEGHVNRETIKARLVIQTEIMWTAKWNEGGNTHKDQERMMQ